MNLWSLLKETASCWSDHEVPRMGAAVAYYAVLSMAPLVVITIAIAGFAFGKDKARDQIVFEVQDVVGEPGAQVIQSVLQNAHSHSSGLIATVLGLITLLIGASGVFIELRTSLNTIWGVPKNPKATAVSETIGYYLFSFTMVLTIGFLLLVSLLLSTFLELFEHWLVGLLPGIPAGAKAFNAVLSFVIVSVLFALIYKFVPNAHIEWSDVIHGAIATALLFTLGKGLLALYIGKMSVGNAYGAAGSLVAMLVWVYYSAQIFFFGAEFTHIYATHRHPIEPIVKA